MLKLILGKAGSGKTAFITNEIKSRIANGETDIFLIVPEQYSHEAERELCSICGDELSLHGEVLSFSRLAVRVAQEIGGGAGVMLDKGGRLLCMSLALSQIGSRLKLYSSSTHKAELQAEMLAAVSELKAACITAGDLDAAAQNAGAELKKKLSDLSLCLEAYDAILAQGHADPNDKLLHLAETIARSKVSGGHIYVDGFTDFTGTEMRVLSSLLGANTDLVVCLTCDALDSDSEHFEPSRRAAHALLLQAQQQASASEVFTLDSYINTAMPLQFYGEKLFSYTSEQQESQNDCITILRADNISSQCELAAARALELIQKTACRRREIAIAIRGADDYAASLEEAFNLYDLPLFIAKREGILQKPLPALISSAFEIIGGGYDTDAVLSYLKTGLAGLSLPDRDLFEGYITLWSIRGRGFTKDAPWVQHPRGFALEADAESAQLLDKINALRAALIAPLKTLAKHGKAAETATAQARALSEFLLEINLPTTLSELSATLDTAGHELLAAEYSQLWEIVLKCLEQFAALLGETPMTQEEFSKLFLQALSQYDVGAIPITTDSITAGDMDRMRRRNIRHLIVLGASDDRLPQVAAVSGILSPDERDELGSLGLALGGGVDALSREFSLIYNCVTLPSDTLTLAYSAFDGSGAPCRESFLISRAKLLFNIKAEAFDLQKARLSAHKPAFLLAAGHFRAPSEASALATAYFAELAESRQQLEQLRERTEKTRGSLSKVAVTALYGEKLSLSPSRADAYSSCRFSYFLRYGLKLNEREKAEFAPPEMGSFVHYVLEHTANEIGQGVGFKNATDELSSGLVDKYTDQYIHETLHNFQDKSPRFIYLFNRLRPQVRRVVRDMVRELACSDFEPLDFELRFGRGGDLPPLLLSDGEHQLQLNGIADRVDGFHHNGKLYLRIIDYKTGKKSFSLSDVWQGIGLQMLLYLFALEHQGRARYNAEIVPAGVLYVPARDEIISADGNLSDEEIAAQRAKKLKRSGLILEDETVIRAMENSDTPEFLPVKYKNGELSSHDNLASLQQLSALNRHVDAKLLELSKNISCGHIEAEPFYRSQQESACVYCPFGSICRFDEARDKKHYLTKLSPDEFWEKVEVEQ